MTQQTKVINLFSNEDLNSIYKAIETHTPNGREKYTKYKTTEHPNPNYGKPVYNPWGMVIGYDTVKNTVSREKIEGEFYHEFYKFLDKKWYVEDEDLPNIDCRIPTKEDVKNAILEKINDIMVENRNYEISEKDLDNGTLWLTYKGYAKIDEAISDKNHDIKRIFDLMYKIESRLDKIEYSLEKIERKIG